MNLYEYEEKLYKNGCKYIAGVDEVGRGPLVGPVVSACVILPEGFVPDGLNDSKKLTEKQRDKFFDIIKDNAIAIGIGVVGPEVIDKINIYEASKESMMIAIKDCNHEIDHVLIDAMKLQLEVPSTPIIKGDAKSISIAAASVIAKVTRDKMMYELDKKYPIYGYGKHKGYPTKKHLEAINKYGLIEGYRKTYKPVTDYINSH